MFSLEEENQCPAQKLRGRCWAIAQSVRVWPWNRGKSGHFQLGTSIALGWSQSTQDR
jgi:hypothetical protein